jgi:hypothetical protein
MSSSDFTLDTRLGWPQELQFLLDRYPRPVWPAHANLGATARFWLDIHQHFRILAGGLRDKTAAFREERMAAPEFRAWFGPRLETLITHMHGHHSIEDFQFFPIFAAAEPKLGRGFEVLESDHVAIHDALARTVADANAFLAASDVDAMRRAADAYAASHDALLKRLDRHLLDEEDLIIPLILDRGEEALGM